MLTDQSEAQSCELSTSERTWAESVFGTELTVTKLAGDASSRIYYRVNTTEDKSYIICRDESLIKMGTEAYPFILTADLFKTAIRVPEIYQVCVPKGLLAIEDFGDDLLECYIADKSRTVEDIEIIYKRVLDDLIKIQATLTKGTLPSKLFFDTEKLMFEFRFFLQHYAENYKKITLSEGAYKQIEEGFLHISKILNNPDLFVLTHRDFHSRNILVQNNRLCYIDFQDARMGLPQYDLVSLLRDAYTVLDNSVYQNFREYYYTNAVEAGVVKSDRDEFNYYFDIMGFQRSIKALGSFGYLVSVKGMQRYEESMSAALSYVVEFAAHRAELSSVYTLLTENGIL